MVKTLSRITEGTGPSNSRYCTLDHRERKCFKADRQMVECPGSAKQNPRLMTDNNGANVAFCSEISPGLMAQVEDA